MFVLIFMLVFSTMSTVFSASSYAAEDDEPNELDYTTGISGPEEEDPPESGGTDLTGPEGPETLPEPEESEELEGLEALPETVAEVMALVFDLPTRDVTVRQDKNRGLVEEKKYIALYMEGTQDYLGYAIHGGEQHQPKAYVPSEKDAIIEFNQEQSQEISIQVLDNNGKVLGVIVTAEFEGQWGLFQGTQYPQHIDICNQVIWDGGYIFWPEEGLDEAAFPQDMIDALKGMVLYPGEYLFHSANKH